MLFFFLFSIFNPILIAAAVIPAIVLMVKVYRADTLEQEPTPLLMKLFLGGVLATFCALITEGLGNLILSRFVDNTSFLYSFLLYFLVVGLSEEGFKYLFLKRWTWFHPAYNCQFDGVVYSVFVSLGFALWENVKYVFRFGLGTALVRAVTAIPGHACFGVFMGAWYGFAKWYDNDGYPEKANRCRFMAVLMPTLLHGAYDYIATRSSGLYTLLFMLFIGILFLTAFTLVQKLSRNDRYIV